MNAPYLLLEFSKFFCKLLLSLALSLLDRVRFNVREKILVNGCESLERAKGRPPFVVLYDSREAKGIRYQ